MQYNYIDTVGTLASTANMYTGGTYPTLSVTGGTLNGATIDLARQDCFSVIYLGTSATGTAAAVTATIGTPGLLTTVGTNGYALGQVGQFTTTGTLPTGISAVTNYFTAPVTGTSFRVATSYANAIGGTFVNITAAGTPTNTFTPTTFAGTISVQLQSSNDNANWISQGTAGTLTAGTALGVVVDRPGYHFIRTSVSGVTAGVLTLNAQILTKSDSYQ